MGTGAAEDPMSGGPGGPQATCSRCRAFLLPGRDDCPFCGADDAALAARTPAAPPLPPPPGTAPTGPVSWASAPNWPAPPSAPPAVSSTQNPPPPPPAMSPPVGPPPGAALPGHVGGGGSAGGAGGVNTRMVVAAVLVLAVLFGGAVKVMSGNERRPAPDDQEGGFLDLPKEPYEVARDKLVALCGPNATPIPEATRYEPTPGPHRGELLVVPAAEDRWLRDEPSWLLESRLPGEEVPDPDPRFELEDLEVVGCYVTSHLHEVAECNFRTTGMSSRVVTVPLYASSGRVVVREAATGKEVGRYNVGEPPVAKCPWTSSTASDGEIVDPEEGAKAVLRMFTHES